METNTSRMINLNGCNYQLWKTRMEDFLYVNGFHQPMICSEKPDDKTNEEWILLHRRVCGFIRHWVDDSVLTHINNETNTRSLWIKLEQLYAPKTSNSTAAENVVSVESVENNILNEETRRKSQNCEHVNKKRTFRATQVVGLPYYGTPPASYQLRIGEAPYYESEPPEQVPDYIQESVHVKLEALDGEANRHDDDGDDDNYDPHYIREATVSYVTNHIFESVKELKDWVVKRGRENGCVIVVRRSNTNSVGLECNRGGEPKIKATVRRTGSIKSGCPFKLKGRYDSAGVFWRLHVLNETHNHDPVGFKEGHPRLRKLTA